MLPNRIRAKLFVNDPASLNLATFIPVFHNWIRDARVPGVPIDVANYSHVTGGASVLLVGHAGDYVVSLPDFAGRRADLSYVHKRDWPGDTLASRLRTTLEGLWLGARLVQQEPRFRPPVSFDAAELALTFPDRLQAPNNARTFSALQDDLRVVLDEVCSAGDVQLTRVTQDKRLLLTVTASASSHFRF